MLRSSLKDTILLYLSTNKTGTCKEIEAFTFLLDGEYYSRKKYLQLSLYRALRELVRSGLVHRDGKYRSTYSLTDHGSEVASHVLARTLVKTLLLEKMIIKNKGG